QHVGDRAEGRADQAEAAADELAVAAGEEAARLRERDHAAAELAFAELLLERLDDLGQAVDQLQRLREDAVAEERAGGDQQRGRDAEHEGERPALAQSEALAEPI